MSEGLKANIQKELVTAMKAKESQRVQAIRNITSAIKKVEVDERKELSDAEVQKIIIKLDKQVKESLAQAKELGREEAIQEAEFELAVFEGFLPKQMSEEDLLALVKETHASMKDQLPEGGAAMGMMMKAVMGKVGASADGKAVQAAVKSVLG